MWISRFFTMAVVVFAAVMALAGIAEAQGFDGESVPWQMGLRDAASPTMERINSFHNFLLIVTVVISVFVLAILGYIMIRFRASRNPNPGTTTHNTALEVLWTVIPIIILVVIAVPSFRLLYFTDRTAEAEMTIKAIGHQWFWSYEYPDHDNLAFDALMIEDADIQEGQQRLLSTDNDIVLPVDTNIRLLTTASDVIHSFAMPSLGIKLDAVPGRTNETWMRIEYEGHYYGQCSELCGARHGFMPISIRAVSREEFDRWVEEAKERFAHDGGSGSREKVAEVRAEKARLMAARAEALEAAAN